LKIQNAIQTMRIIQIIDSLDAGGAERMAVSYANGLVDEIAFSGLVVSRKEGPLLQQIDERVSYLFLNKKKTFDIAAVLQLRRYVQQHKIDLVHAHSTSFFLAFLLKLSYPKIRLLWHDHYGDSEFLEQRPSLVLRMLLPFFSGVIVVNQKLKIWVDQKLKVKNSFYLPNFPTTAQEVLGKTSLKGVAGKRIVCLANLRPQKDHFLLLSVAEHLKQTHSEWTFHLVGKDFQDTYSEALKSRIVALDLEKNVFLYGSKQDVTHILTQATVAILTSKSEGLPVALLEYGQQKKPVLVTNVGEISSLVLAGENGLLVPAENPILFHEALVALIESESLQKRLGLALYQSILTNYASKAILQQYLTCLAIPY
jgi:glycosyltransferase involved in cell wall biosynthesis